MDQKNLLTQTLDFIQGRRRYRRWLRAVTAMAAVVVFVTTYLLILPAITKEHGLMEVEAANKEAALGENITAGIYAASAGDGEETFFVLNISGDNAGLDERTLNFNSDGVAVLRDENGKKIELHREYQEDASVLLWFTLGQGQSSSFELPWVNGVDRFHSRVTEEKVPVISNQGETEDSESAESQDSQDIQTPESDGDKTAQTPEEDGNNNTVQTPEIDGDNTAPETDGNNKTAQTPEADGEDNITQTPDGDKTAQTPEPDGDDNTAQMPEQDGDISRNVPEQDAEESSADNVGERDLSSSDITGKGNGLHTGTLCAVSLGHRSTWDIWRSAAALQYSAAVTDPAQDGEYTVIYHTEIIRDEQGDADKAGNLTLSFGSGETLEEARSRANEHINFSWAEPEGETYSDNSGQTNLERSDAASGTSGYVSSEATVEKEGFHIPAANAVRTVPSAVAEAAAEAKDGSYDFTENITSVTVSRLENGQWVSGNEFTDGDSVRVEINYTIPANTVGAENQTIYYQLPEGIRLPGGESGTVYDGMTPVGSYVIGSDGLITITFNEDFSDDRPFSGIIRFEGTLSAGEDGNEQQIEFGGSGGTITVKPSTSPTDISVAKTGNYSNEDEKLHYTITVSTDKGTADTVTITDNFQYESNTRAEYDTDSFQIVKVKDDGSSQETVTGYTLEITSGWGAGGFTISNLPKLEAGEKYIVTYTATPQKSTDASGASSIANSATGTSGNDTQSSWNNVTISNQMIKKEGALDTGTGKIKWTITLNPDKRDIGGYVLKDEMTINGEKVSIPAGTVITMKGSNGSPQTITLPYTFPTGSNDTYTITYETNAPTAKPGESWAVTNQAELTRDDDTYEAGNQVVGTNRDYNVTKSFDGRDENASTNTVGTYKWVSRIEVPQTNVELDKLTYTDTLKGAALGGAEVADSHYITPALLDKLTVIVNGTALERGTDYNICDAGGNVIDDFTAPTHLTGFQVKFLDGAKDKITGQTIELRYQTQVDYSMLTGEGPYTIVNKGSIPEHESEASTTYEKQKKLEKQASITGEGGSSYTDDSIQIDYTASGGVIHYRLLIHTDENTQGDITLTDLIPKGAKLVEDSVKMAFYGNDWHEYDENGSGYKASEHIKATVGDTKEDGTTPVTFTIDEGYNGDGQYHVLVVYYDLTIRDDPLWTDDPALETHIYHNEVTWGGESDGTDVTVEREVPDVKKTGVQLPQYDVNGDHVLDEGGDPVLSNTIRYYITVNAGGEDLVPGMEFITLWDKLDVDKASGAEFLPASVKLYHYDTTKENNCGVEIDPNLYAYTYDETEYVLTFNLPDETACVLVYEYIIDRGSAAGDLTIKNEAHLTGGTSSGDHNEVIFEDTSSSAVATKKVLTIYKVDATNYGKLLRGAVFRLEVYNTDKKEWETLLDDLITDENGQFTLTRDQDEHFENFNFEDNTLYRLTETTPPPGYAAIDTKPYYFVWVKDGDAVEDVRQMIINSGALENAVASESVHFLTTSGAMYIPNQPTELTVKKLWQDEAGMTISPGAESVELKLYQQAMDSNAKTVTVKSTGHQGWSNTHTSVVNVADESSLTIQITSVYKDSLDIQVGSGDKVSVPTGAGQVWSYTIDSITADTMVNISPTDQGEGNSFGNISFSGYTTPSYIPIGDEKVYKTVTLNADNNWSYTWSNLPKQNEKGQDVYYHVREVTTVPGFEVIYSTNNNDGVLAGDLTVINRTTGYVLPESGGPGISLLTAGGAALMVLSCLMYYIKMRKKGRGSL